MYIPFVKSSYQNWTDLGILGGLDKGFYSIYINSVYRLKTYLIENLGKKLNIFMRLLEFYA